MPECNCLVPYFEGAGQHSPGCAVFDAEPEESSTKPDESDMK